MTGKGESVIPSLVDKIWKIQSSFILTVLNVLSIQVKQFFIFLYKKRILRYLNFVVGFILHNLKIKKKNLTLALTYRNFASCNAYSRWVSMQVTLLEKYYCYTQCFRKYSLRFSTTRNNWINSYECSSDCAELCSQY